MRWLPFLLVLSLCAALLGCQVEVYRGLTEAQVNTMLSTLLKRGIRAEKTAAGKAGFTLSVDEDQLVQSLEILKENNLPRADYENLGKVFSGQGMISSASEEQARMAYAARAAEWAAICLDRRGDRLFGGARRTCAVGAFPA